jgi:hypothetical protein
VIRKLLLACLLSFEKPGCHCYSDSWTFSCWLFRSEIRCSSCNALQFVHYHPWKYLDALGRALANAVKFRFRETATFAPAGWLRLEGNQRSLEYVVIVLLLAVGAIATGYLAKRLP